MHELSVTQSILEICLTEARKNALNKISEINIRLGKFSTFAPDCIISYFKILSKGTIAEGAQVNFSIVKIKTHCPNCQAVNEITEPVFICPVCGKPGLEIVEGREFFVENLTGEEEVK